MEAPLLATGPVHPRPQARVLSRPRAPRIHGHRPGSIDGFVEAFQRDEVLSSAGLLSGG